MSLKETISNIKLYEASLGRLMQHLEKGDCLLFISANRNENTEKENNKNFKELQRYVKIANFGYNKIEGHYVEENSNGKKVPVSENSLVVFAPADKENILFKLGIQLGRRFNQDSILFINSKKEAQFYATKEGTKIGKRYFTFKTVEEVKSKHNLGDRLLSESFIELLESSANPLIAWDRSVEEDFEVKEICKTSFEKAIKEIIETQKVK